MARGNVSGNGIVTDGLVLALDAANPKSYISGSTVWRDLSGYNNHVDLINNPGFDSTLANGCVTFDGANSYGTINSNASLTITRPTLIVACTTTANGLNQTVITKGGYSFYWNYGLTKVWPTTFAARNNNADLASPTISILTSVLNIYAIVWDGSAVQFYRNGQYVGSNSTSYSPIATNGLFVRIACAWNQASLSNVEFYQGKISTIQIYNRALSTTEVLQNYNATKARFGLQ